MWSFPPRTTSAGTSCRPLPPWLRRVFGKFLGSGTWWVRRGSGPVHCESVGLDRRRTLRETWTCPKRSRRRRYFLRTPPPQPIGVSPQHRHPTPDPIPPSPHLRTPISLNEGLYGGTRSFYRKEVRVQPQTTRRPRTHVSMGEETLREKSQKSGHKPSFPRLLLRQPTRRD